VGTVGGLILPWDLSSVEKHNKGLSKKQKEQWVAVANSSRESCLKKGKTEKECDAQAIRIANAVVKTHGGPGSGNFGHAGRPGKVGGSSGKGGGKAIGRVDDGKDFSEMKEQFSSKEVQESIKEDFRSVFAENLEHAEQWEVNRGIERYENEVFDNLMYNPRCNESKVGMKMLDCQVTKEKLPTLEEWIQEKYKNDEGKIKERLSEVGVAIKQKKDNFFQWDDAPERHYGIERAGAVATVQSTQKAFEKMGIKQVTLYRGLGESQQLSSSHPTFWTTDKSFAEGFATERGVVVSTKVNIKNILYSSYTVPTVGREYKEIKKDIGVNGADEILVSTKGFTGVRVVGRGRKVSWGPRGQ
jgi:hypothetical protein